MLAGYQSLPSFTSSNKSLYFNIFSSNISTFSPVTRFWHCDTSLRFLPLNWAWMTHFCQQHWDYFQTGLSAYQRLNWNQHFQWFEACPTLFLPLLSEKGDMGLRYVTKDSSDKKTASLTDLWWQAFELWESALAYRYNTMHTKVAHLLKHINTNKHLLKFTQKCSKGAKSLRDWARGKGILNEDMKC